jgi:hypothetical protein
MALDGDVFATLGQPDQFREVVLCGSNADVHSSLWNEQLVIERETNMQNDVAQLADDLDKAPSGEAIIERLLTGQILLQRENAELKAKLDKALDQMLLLANLVDSDHAAILVLQGQRHQGGIVQ